MTKIVMVAHGEIETDVDLRFCGQIDSDLTLMGRRQASDVGEVLRSDNYDHVFVSDLFRATETARLIGYTDVILSESLRERSGGEYEGYTFEELRDRLPPKSYKLWERDYFEAPLGGESIGDVYDRVVGFFNHTIRPLCSENTSVLIVAHPTPIMALLGYLKRFEEIEIPKITVHPTIPYVFRGDLPEVSER